MVGLAVLNLALVTQSVLDTGTVNPGVLVSASLQVSEQDVMGSQLLLSSPSPKP